MRKTGEWRSSYLRLISLSYIACKPVDLVLCLGSSRWPTFYPPIWNERDVSLNFPCSLVHSKRRWPIWNPRETGRNKENETRSNGKWGEYETKVRWDNNADDEREDRVAGSRSNEISRYWAKVEGESQWDNLQGEKGLYKAEKICDSILNKIYPVHVRSQRNAAPEWRNVAVEW